MAISITMLVSTTTQDIIRTDFFNFQQATGFAPTDARPYPTLEQLIARDSDPRSDSRIIRDPRNVENVQMIMQSDSNASTMLVRACTSVDALYSYRGIEMFGGSLSLTGGVRNVFDREAQKTGMIAGVVTELQDVLDRVVQARLNYDF